MCFFLGIDIGTTHCKTGIFSKNGHCEGMVIKDTVTHYDKDGDAFYDPKEVWKTIEDAMTEVLEIASVPIEVIGISSMAETGVLVDRFNGEPVFDMIPWFDRRAEKEVDEIARQYDPYEQFIKTGLHPSFKYGLPKLLWIQKQNSDILKRSVWLSASDYIAHCLTGSYSTDYTLAARTYAFRIDRLQWDEDVLKHHSLDKSNFPNPHPSGETIGFVKTNKWNSLGLKAGTPVAISGHDHVCSSVGSNACDLDSILDSMGTAETLLGTISIKPLGKLEYQSGLTFGRHVIPNHYFWMGGLPASGGSIEWIRKIVGEDILSYEQIEHLLNKAKGEPTDILYFPYLAGAGAPNPDQNMKATLFGLTSKHGRPELVKSVLEGIAFQMEAILHVGQRMAEKNVSHLNVVGGGTKNQHLMQLKANISNVPIMVLKHQEATLLGAVVIAAIGCGIYSDVEEAMREITNPVEKQYNPNPLLHQKYKEIYENRFKPFLEILNQTKAL